MRIGLTIAAGFMAGILSAPPLLAQDASTLSAVKARGKLICGSDGARPGISAPDSQGVWGGFEVMFCRAVAAVVLDDPDAVEFVPLSTVTRFPALQSGQIDLLARSTTVNLSRSASLGFSFSPITMYSMTGIMVHADLDVATAKDLDGATVCTPPGASAERNVADFAEREQIGFQPLVIEGASQLNEAYLSRRCDAMANFVPGLAIIRAFQAPDPQEHVILPFVLAKEPLAIAVRQDDVQWHKIVTWIVYATIFAEEKGITSANVDEALSSDDPEIAQFLGVTSNFGEMLGIPNDFAYRVVKHVGNYGEIWENTVGMNSPLRLDRGQNELWTNSGLHYSPPFQ
jgi:general L-amino acid transport system substrate-binding protein